MFPIPARRREIYGYGEKTGENRLEQKVCSPEEEKTGEILAIMRNDNKNIYDIMYTLGKFIERIHGKNRRFAPAGTSKTRKEVSG